MTSPNTLNIRPRVASPTGTVIVVPGAQTSIPRARPSLPANMIHRTVSCPTCWDTSMVRVPWPTETVRASRILGR